MRSRIRRRRFHRRGPQRHHFPHGCAQRCRRPWRRARAALRLPFIAGNCLPSPRCRPADRCNKSRIRPRQYCLWVRYDYMVFRHSPGSAVAALRGKHAPDRLSANRTHVRLRVRSMCSPGGQQPHCTGGDDQSSSFPRWSIIMRLPPRGMLPDVQQPEGNIGRFPAISLCAAGALWRGVRRSGCGIRAQNAPYAESPPPSLSA